jgi:hypothetical protein
MDVHAKLQSMKIVEGVEGGGGEFVMKLREAKRADGKGEQERKDERKRR